ncbi:probable WRKY transcription factor 14 [Phragmites australis]|uniref:probable WRKY transcription factor 14 n=1 Tax=Phragmites australis TaxID=29695 RepID=UPI002D7833D7|nr:probable WRKY transcription factor 14 [Phragmites australis]
MEEANAGTAQGDLADVVARASAMAALPSTSHRPPPPSPAADHISSAAMAGHIMIPYEEDRRLAAVSIDCGDAVMFQAPSTVDPYLSTASATAPRGEYWRLPPAPQQLAVQISQHACYGGDVVMGGAAADIDGDDAIRISPVTPPAAAHQMMKRKNEAKKVVCIPALPATSSRPGGEVIPSDLWAWRKYGQKPIKGSPYPRGYYRCSSSKGCMARKQVERNRSDPNMLVITYTAEHNHPWPMQRNVLAGYSRPHTQVTTNCKKKNSCRVDPTSSSSSSSKNVNYYSKQNEIVDGDLGCQQPTTNAMEGNASGYGAYTISALGREGVVMHEPTSCDGIQAADEVFAELEELDPSNIPVNANIYSRGVSYEWHKF